MNTINVPIEHPDRQLLLRMLSIETGSHLESATCQHVESCPECLSQLESLAADPEMWRHVATLCDRNNLGETIGMLSDVVPLVNADRRASWEPGNHTGELDEHNDLFPIQSLLNKPSHPEMMGRLGNYDIEYEIGRGGMGVVLKAFDSDLNRPVAIKLMSPTLAGRGVARERFAREARAAAAVLHPNVIAIYGVAATERIPYLVMPFIKGPSIEQLVEQNGPLSEKEIVCFAMQIAAGLAAAHAQGVVHRDIKPANILIENGVGRVIITDFGLARAESEVSMTQTGWFAGTPAFMSPEQATGQEMDTRSDLFSLGGVMYYMATGRVPFRADQPMAILDRIRNEQQRAARSINSDVSQTLSDVIDRLLAKRPDERIQSAALLQQLMEQYLAHLQQPTITCKPRIEPLKSQNRVKAQVRPMLLAASALILAGSAIVWFFAGSGFNYLPDPNGTPLTLEQQEQSIADRYQLITVDQFNQRMRTVEVNMQSISQLSESEWNSGFESTGSGFRELDQGIAEVEQALTRIETELSQ